MGVNLPLKLMEDYLAVEKSALNIVNITKYVIVNIKNVIYLRHLAESSASI